MKASMLCFLVLAFLLPSLLGFSAVERLGSAVPMAQSLNEWFDPDQYEEKEPMEVKQIIGFVIAGLASFVILLFVFSFLMGPGERIREKVSEATDPFFTIVAILLIVLVLALVQTYYSQLIEWLRLVVSSG